MARWDITEKIIMKLLFKTFAMLLFVGVLFTNKLNAQMTLEHTFEGEVYPTTCFGEYYFSYEEPGDDSYVTVKIYNPDYSLNKEVTLYPLEGYSRIWINWVYAPDLILAESETEFYDYENGICYCMYDSNGNIIKNWGRGYYADNDIIDINIPLQNKLTFSIHNRTTGDRYTEIYSIDGYESVKNVRATSFGHAYPNPARNTISLPYNLNKGEQAEMLIYDVNGKMIEKKTIDSTFDKILLNVESYTPGIYFYSVNGVSHKFVVNR